LILHVAICCLGDVVLSAGHNGVFHENFGGQGSSLLVDAFKGYGQERALL